MHIARQKARSTYSSSASERSEFFRSVQNRHAGKRPNPKFDKSSIKTLFWRRKADLKKVAFSEYIFLPMSNLNTWLLSYVTSCRLETYTKTQLNWFSIEPWSDLISTICGFGRLSSTNLMKKRLSPLYLTFFQKTRCPETLFSDISQSK